MKTILLLLLTGVLFSIRMEAKELSKEEALKIGQDNDGAGNGKFWWEHGDASPPFTHAGHIVVSRGGGFTLDLNDDEGDLGVRAPDDDGSETRVDIFTSAKGKGWATAHVLKPEVRAKPAEAAPKDERPAEHRYLSMAAELALEKNDTVFLKSLFKRGLLINEALDFEKGNTLLHEAAWKANPEMVKFFLKNGARSDIRDRSGSLPIHAAIKLEDKALCKLLAKTGGGGKEKNVDGIPAGLIPELLPQDTLTAAKEVYFIAWKGEDPPAGIMAEIVKTLPKARAKSKMETIKRRPLGARSWYQDTGTKEYGELIEIEVKEVTAEESAKDAKDAKGEAKEPYWEATIRTTTGPFLAGGGRKEKFRKAYGYWYGYDFDGWDE